MGYKIADSASIQGKTILGKGAYISQGARLRAMDQPIWIGGQSMVLENSVVVGSNQFPSSVGEKTVFGHQCIVLGSKIGNLCEIGNRTIFMPGVMMGDRCITGEGTLIPTGMQVPDDSVLVGRPARILRKLTPKDIEMIRNMRGGDLSLGSVETYSFSNPIKGEAMGKLYSYKDKYPSIGEGTYLADDAEVTGDVIIGKNSIIGAGARIIGDGHGPVVIGDNVQILENCVLHLLPGNKLVIKDNVVIGPGAIVHGSFIGQGTVIESGALVCDDSQIGENCLIKAGSLVKQRSLFESQSIIEGFPAKMTGTLLGTVEKPAWAY
jgi:carbonic anhydrase/acetyltransferase-like protein (isoleucine patch superfamily)